MTYQNMLLKVIPSLLKKYGDSKKIFDAFMNAERKKVSVEKINEKLSTKSVDGNKYEGPLLQENKFTEEEKAHRAEQYRKVREKMANYAIPHVISAKQAEPLVAEKIIKEKSKGKLSSGDRYPEELMYDISGTPEAAEKNAKISALFINARDVATDLKPGEENPYTHEINDLHKKLVSRCEKINVDHLLDHEPSIDELIDNFELLEECKGLAMQVQNIREAYKQMKIPLPAKLEKRMEALLPKFRILEKYEQKLATVNSPYYPEIDPEDPALLTITVDGVAGEVTEELAEENSYPEDFGMFDSEFSAYYGDVSSYENDYYAVELEAIGEIMQSRGTEKKDIAFEIDGKVFEKPFYRPSGKDIIDLTTDKLSQLQSGEIKSIRVFDKNHPEREIKIPRTVGKDYPFSKMRVGQMHLDAPQRPAAVPKPNFFKRWFNSWFGAFEQECSAYRGYEAEMAIYNEKMAAKETLEETQREFVAETAENRKNNAKKMPGHVASQVDRELFAQRFTGEEMESFEDIYGAEREFRKDWDDRSVYADQAEAIKTGNISLERVSPNGKTLNNHQFAMMAAMCGLSNPFFDNRGEEYNRNTKKFTGLKLPSTIMFEDLISTGMNPRAGLNGVLKNTIEPARRFLADCLKNFDKPMPGKEPATGREELAKTMTDGLKRYASRLKARNWINSADITTTEVGAQALDLAKELGMMDDLKANGLTEQELEDIAVAREVAKVKKDELDAGYKIMQEAEGEIKLTEAERLDCLNKIALGKALQLETQLYGDSQVPDMDEPVHFEGMPDKEYSAQMVEFGVQYSKAMENIEKVKQVSPVVKNLTKDGSELKKLAEKFLPEEQRQALAKGSAKDIFDKLVGKVGGTTKYYDDFVKTVPPYEKVYLKVEGLTNTNGFLGNKRQTAFTTMHDPNATPESLEEAAATLLVCRALSGAKFNDDAEKFDKGMEQMKSSKVFQSLAKNKENLKEIAGMGSERKMTEKLLKSYEDEKKSLAEAAKAAKKQKTTTNEKKKENVASV